MNILQTTKDLIDEGLEVSIGKWLSRSDDSRQITFHELYPRSAPAHPRLLRMLLPSYR